MKTTEEIIKPYKNLLEKINYKNITEGLNPDLYLFSRWAYRVGKGWYGFALSKDAPFLWAQIIDEFLVELEKSAPNFTIHQIKLKFGGLRFYIQDNIDTGKNISQKQQEINNEISKLEDILFSEDLIY